MIKYGIKMELINDKIDNQIRVQIWYQIEPYIIK